MFAALLVEESAGFAELTAALIRLGCKSDGLLCGEESQARPAGLGPELPLPG
jgi:hypothetical protein